MFAGACKVCPWGAMGEVSYDIDTVWKALDVPLHPGAAKHYRDRGYMK